MKTCSKCHKEKPDDEFYIARYNDGRTHPRADCKLCNIEGRKAYSKKIWATPSPQKAKVKARRKELYDPQKKRRYAIIRHGITVEEHDVMFLTQQGVCAVCGLPPNKKNKQNWSLNIDHDHITGKVRGLLCGKCNTALGLLNEDQETIKKLLRYVEEKC